MVKQLSSCCRLRSGATLTLGGELTFKDYSHLIRR
ncbi:hypothetical protein SPLC1_S040580 [Arthrospira platensis C1]|nr:hypothetical protein SPLC1_S040580 [Arthrospira platensis C1]